MNSYLEIANSPVMYLGVAVLLALVMWQSVVFISRSLRRARELGISAQRLKKAALTAAVTSVVPSTAIIIALMTLAPVLGLPFSWGRLSVIGSLSYELLAAELGAKAAGVPLGGAGYDSSAFLTSAVTMTCGSFVTLLLTICFFKWYKERLNRSLGKTTNNAWSRILVATIIVSMYARFMAEPLAMGGVALVTMLVSAATMVLIGLLVKKAKLDWLADFATSISMIVGMGAAVLYSL